MPRKRLGVVTISCGGCGTMVKEEDTSIVDNREVCNDCIVSCVNCGSNSIKEDCVEEDGNYLCENCGDNFAFCYSCSTVRDIESGEEYNNKWYCRHCVDSYFFWCDCCDNHIHINERGTTNTRRDGSICYSCIDDYYTHCESCGRLLHYDDTYTYDNYSYCESCYDDIDRYDEEDGDGELRNCSFVPRNLPFYRTDRDNPECSCYGMELETDQFNTRSGAINELYPIGDSEKIFWQTSDGSLAHGIEITYAPRSYNSWMGMASHLKKVGRTVYNHGGKCYKSGSCGIHIHRGRTDITPVDEVKLMAFFTICRRQIEKFAQRQSITYARYDHLQSCSESKSRMARSIKEKRHSYEKYQAINFGPPNTIEFRIFKGTLNPNTIMAYIGFTHFSVQFIKSLFIQEILDMNKDQLWQEFCYFIMRRATQECIFPIISYLERRRLLTIKRTELKAADVVVDDTKVIIPEGLASALGISNG